MSFLSLRKLSRPAHDAQRDPQDSTCFHLSDPPYDNYFYSDRHVHSQLVVTSPLPDSDTARIRPRLLVAWPSGNSGVCAYFQPLDGADGTLQIELRRNASRSPVGPVYVPQDGRPSVGVKGVVHLNKPAILSVAILGSIRTIRDYVEGPSILIPEIQDAMELKRTPGYGAAISRLWLDGVTTTTLSFRPVQDGKVVVDRGSLVFDSPGDYEFAAHYNYPQLKQLSIDDVLNDEARDAIRHDSDGAKSLSFLSYSDKILAGAWKFLTYFGRDSMLSALLMEPILSDSAMEAVLGAVLERINRVDGSACHEEVIGDYATWLNLKDGKTSTAARCDYNMIDTEFFIPILLERYLKNRPTGQRRLKDFLSIAAGKVEVNNEGLTWGDLAIRTASKIIDDTAAFAAPGGQKVENMVHLKGNHPVGNWRDSNVGLGNGRVPFDVNTALVPAALRAIAALGYQFGEAIWGPNAGHWSQLADRNAQVWEDEALAFFEMTVPATTARHELIHFVKTCEYYDGPSHAEMIDADVTYYAVALEGSASDKPFKGKDDLPKVPILHSDTSFRLFFGVKSTNRAQEMRFLNATALSILRPFPAGLLTPMGMLVANSAYASNLWLHQNFGHAAYHGAVIWGWQLAMMAKGLENQLVRWTAPTSSRESCDDPIVYTNIRKAYNVLWDVIEANRDHLADEVWSWRYQKDTLSSASSDATGPFEKKAESEETFKYAQLGSLPPPPGASASVESNAMQLWSLTFLAMTRNERWR